MIEDKKVLEAIIEMAPTCVKLVAADGTLQRMNRAGLAMIEADSLDQVRGKSIYPLVSEEYRESFKTLTQDVFKGKSGTLEFKMVGLKGRPLWLFTHAVPLSDEKGKVISLLAVTIDITDRKEAEKALRENEQRLKKAQQIAHIGDWEWEIDTGKVHWSDELYHVYGYEPHEIAPDYALVVGAMHPDSKGRFLSAIDAALRGERPFEMDYTFYRKDGSVAVLHTIGKVLCGKNGAPERMVGTVQDITERMRAEDALRESEEKFRTIFESSNDGLLIADYSSRKFIAANQKICSMLGYGKEEIVGLGIEDIHPKESTPHVLEEYGRQMKGEIMVARDLPVMRKDGSVFYADIGATFIMLGGIHCSVGTFRDVTERREAEAALRRSEEFVKNILDTVDESFLVMDRDFRIMTANRAYCNSAGLALKGVIGKRCHEITHKTPEPCYEQGEECPVLRTFETGETHVSLHRHPDEKGNILYVETRAFPMRDNSGNVSSVIETITNITEKHLLEEERLKTQKLEAIGTLAGGIAHDFNNLLQGVFGYMSMAKITYDQKEKSLYMLDQAEKALHMSVDLARQLLTFSKGGNPVKRKIMLQPIIDNSVRFALSGSRVDCRIETEGPLSMIEADEGQIGQVIQNIVLNSDQAMPMGGTILITSRNVSAPREGPPAHLKEGNYVEISVKDTGIGIPGQYLPKIFDPYFTTKEKGSGLGLATAYSIIRNHGGVIDVKSELGKGSTFFIYLPAIEADGEKVEPVLAAKAIVGKGRILLMDDEEIVRDVAGELLRALGHEAEFALNGEEAVIKYREAMASGRKFDIVILDLTIRGGAGGEEAIRELLAIDPDIKAVVSSGYIDNSTISEYSKRGFKACLTKPYTINGLKNTLDALLI